MSAYTEIPKIIAETGELPPKVLDYLASQFIRTGTLATSVDQYGAVGDGTTDDTSAIQAAVDDAAQPDQTGTVYLPGGTYAVTGLDIPDNVALTGAGNATLRITPSTRERVIDLHGDRAGLTNINIDGNANEHTIGRQYLVWVSGEGTRIADLNITDSRDRCVHVAPTARHISISNVILARNGAIGNCNGFYIQGQYVTISGCHVYDHGNGHAFIVANTMEARAAYVTITNCVVERSEHNAFTLETGAQHVIIANCVAKDVPQAVKGDGTARNITVIGCIFERITLRTAFNMGSVDYTLVSGVQLKDSAGWISVGHNSVVQGCTIENIGIGETEIIYGIYIRSGTVSGCNLNGVHGQAIRVTHRANIQGCTIVDSGDDATRYLINTDGASSTTIKGNTFVNPQAAASNSGLIYFNSPRAVISGNVLEGEIAQGVIAGSGADNYVITENVLTGAVTPVVTNSASNRVVTNNL